MSEQPDNRLDPAEELVPEDDAVIGHAFRWSLAVIVVGAAAVGVTVWALSRPQPETPPTEVEPDAPEVVRHAEDPPAVPFTDVTTGSGIDFVHVNGATGEKLLPETMGGGCAFLDYDGDGDQDLLLVNSQDWPGSGDGHAGTPVTTALYANDGAGHFRRAPEAGLGVELYGMGVAVGDVDNDGDPDVYITAVGRNRLFLNEAGRFRDVTDEAGVGGDAGDWSTSAGFFDADGDGDLDLFVCNYVRWSREIDFAVDYRLTGLGRAYGPPTNFQGAFPVLYRNEGDGTFTDVSAASGVRVTNPDTGVPVAKALGVTFADADRDGLLDIFVANDTVRNFLFRNRGDGTFEEIGARSGVAYGSMGESTGAMGVDAGHYRNDDALGIAIGNFANEMSSLYVSQTDPSQYADEAIGEGLGAPSRKVLSFGVFLFDYDLDGRLDLLQANGHLEEEINTVQPSQHYRQAPQLFYNAGPDARRAFVEVDAATTGDLAEPIVGRGAAYADVDGDGDLDVVLTQIGDRPRLLRNDQTLGHRWLRVRLVGRTCNRDAIGAVVELTPSPLPGREPATLRRTVMPTRSYLSQVELPVTFGLGARGEVAGLRVRWPDGTSQSVAVDELDTTIVVEQETGTGGGGGGAGP